MSSESITRELTCGYCLSVLGDGEVMVCEGCGTRYHADCWSDYGACAVLGCPTWTERQMVDDRTVPRSSLASAAVSPTAVTSAAPAVQADGATAVAAPAGWHADPLRRHEHRYWNGAEWTALVSDRGVPTTDPHGTRPTPVPPPAGNARSAAAWYPDPTTRHQYRYWAGRRWTDKVANDGVQTVDPPTMEAS